MNTCVHGGKLLVFLVYCQIRLGKQAILCPSENTSPLEGLELGSFCIQNLKLRA